MSGENLIERSLPKAAEVTVGAGDLTAQFK